MRVTLICNCICFSYVKCATASHLADKRVCAFACMSISSEHLVSLGCPCDQEGLDALVEWLKLHKFKACRDLRGAGDVRKLKGKPQHGLVSSMQSQLCDSQVEMHCQQKAPGFETP